MDNTKRVGTFCEKCRNPMCICGKNYEIRDSETVFTPMKESKTAKQWFTEYFPEPLRTQAINSITNNSLFRSLDQALFHSFCWSENSNGDFDIELNRKWVKVHEDIKNGKYSTPITESPMRKYFNPPPPPAPKQKTIYGLGLHETLRIAELLSIQRVPGGWNYHYEYSQSIIVFVPFNNEFQNK